MNEMKKIVVIGAAALCATVAMGDVESSEIVGYSVKELSEGNQAVATQFYTIGKDGVSLLDLTFDTSAQEKILGTLRIQILDANGITTKTYAYFKNAGSRSSYGVDGWYDMHGDTLITAENDPLFKNGQGLWLGSPAGVKLTTAGGVLKDSQCFELKNGNTMIANPFPVSVKLLDLVLGGTFDTAEKILGTIRIQILDANGITTKTYAYFKNAGSRSSYGADGWYDMHGDVLITNDNNPSFAAGEALWFGGIDGATVTFPAPKF